MREDYWTVILQRGSNSPRVLPCSAVQVLWRLSPARVLMDGYAKRSFVRSLTRPFLRCRSNRCAIARVTTDHWPVAGNDATQWAFLWSPGWARFGGKHARTRGELMPYISSGVTKVGVTRGGNWWCHLFFSSKKLTTFFSYRPPLQSNDLLAVVSSPLPPSDVVNPVFFLNSATKNCWVSPPPPGCCHPRRS